MYSVDCCWLGNEESRIWCHRKTKTTLREPVTSVYAVGLDLALG